MADEIDVKIGTPEEAFWFEVVKDTERQVKATEKSLKFLNKVLEMAKVEQEKEKQ